VRKCLVRFSSEDAKDVSSVERRMIERAYNVGACEWQFSVKSAAPNKTTRSKVQKKNFFAEEVEGAKKLK
jgi:hypothetical protein